ncbi:hypothetical protein CEXT_673071 [Caerostris extrusa]|uniref:Uncharacterized protein n=1 Tax=Caerostris extrusa TaxID=172846 RepID=A0AAV4W072_CAEEX|nr:hypothetical protein CEXT_673071 [Caerostris extrusa]
MSSRDITMPSRDEKGPRGMAKLMKSIFYQILVVTGILMTVSKRLAKCSQEMKKGPQGMAKLMKSTEYQILTVTIERLRQYPQ